MARRKSDILFDGRGGNASSTCSRPGCRKPVSFAPVGDNRLPLCVAHARPSEPCAHKGCGRKASHGVKGTREQEFCVEHAKQGMVNLRSKRCAHPGCFKIPTYGLEGSKIRDFCAPHAEPGMININSTKCIHAGCNVEASFGVRGDGRRLLCSKHFNRNGGSNPRNRALSGKIEGIPTPRRGTTTGGVQQEEYIVPRPPRGLARVGFHPCAQLGCCHRRTHGVKGSATPQLCRQHADKGMVDLVIQRCSSRGCAKLAKFGMPNSWTREFCAPHAGAMMVKDGATVEYPTEGEGLRKRKEYAYDRHVGFPYDAGEVADQIGSKKSCTAAVSTRAKAARDRCAVEPKALREGTCSEPSSPSSDGANAQILAGPRMLNEPARRHWPGTALLQTPTGWSRWKWPSSLSRVALWPSE